MHDAYDGKWFKTLTFVQKTTLTRPNGVVDTSTWYEALKSPDRLRIDFGDPSKGNGALYTADSLYVVRGGKVTRAIADGNPFLPFVAGVYDQPLQTTLRQLAPYRFDLSRIRAETWQGQPVYVVGAASPQDLDSPQFWIERDRLQPVRILVKLSPAPDAKPNDIRLESYVPLGGGWLATRVLIMEGGVVRQAETTATGRATWRCRMILVAEKWSQSHTGFAELTQDLHVYRSRQRLGDSLAVASVRSIAIVNVDEPRAFWRSWGSPAVGARS